jgi:hypothetical protein
MKLPFQTGRLDASERQPAKQGGTNPSEPLPDPKVGAIDTFISLAQKSGTPEERRARIDSVLKLLGLPSIDEVNRMDSEANAQANKGGAKDETS